MVPEDAGAAAVGLRAPLAAVLARFQLGEAGEGRVARDIDDCRLPAVDDDYRRALKLFVREEGRHARILAGIVRTLGGQLLAKQASNDLFRWCRRLLGLRFKLLVLLVAEIVGSAIYDLLGARLRPGALRAALAQISADEQVHLRFHAAFLRLESTARLRRPALRTALWVVTVAAAVVVVLENRRALRALGLHTDDVVRPVWRRLRDADQVAFAPAAASTHVATQEAR